MKIHYFVWIAIALFFLLYGCKKRNHETNYAEEISSIVKKMTNKNIIFSDSLLQILSESGNDNFIREERKIISVIAGNCGACVMTLKNWESCFREMKDQGYENRLLFIIEDIDSALFKKIYRLEIPSGMTLVFDRNSVFSKQNELPNDKMLKTFMIDTENNVVLVGNPSLDKELWILYLNELERE